MLSPFSSVSAGGTTENVLTSLTPPLTRAKTTARNDPDRNDGLAGARASLIPASAPPGADARGHRVRGRAERGPAMGKGGVGVRFRRLEWLEDSRQQPPDSCQGGEPLAVAGCWSVTDSGASRAERRMADLCRVRILRLRS